MAKVMTKLIVFSCDEKLHDEIKKRCEEKGNPISPFIRLCVKKQLEIEKHNDN